MIYDTIVIGGGPGGYLAAERCGQAGLNTLLIEKTSLGGTCLNEGCIPTKTLLNSAKIFRHCDDKVSAPFGVSCENANIDHGKIMMRKDQVVKTLVSGIEMQMKQNHVTVKNGIAHIQGKKNGLFQVAVDEETFEAANLIIATGSNVLIPPIPGVQEQLASGFVETSHEFLSDHTVPKSVVIAGGGVIGLEMAYYYNALGTHVTVIEMLDKIGGALDEDIAKRLQDVYKREGICFILNAKLTEIGESSLTYTVDEVPKKLECDRLLLCLGRIPATKGIGLETLGIALGKKSEILTDNQMKTNIKNCYAVGDVNGKIMLAHTAYREAECAVNTILGIEDAMDYRFIPSVIYSHPEVAFVGYTVKSAHAAGYEDVELVQLPMQYAGRYVAENNNGTGICKLVFDKKNKCMIGAHIMSDYASEMIVICSMLITMKITVPEMKKLVFPHPTVGEIIREAIWASKIK